MAVIRNKNVKVNGVIAGADAVSNIDYNIDFDLITKQLNKQKKTKQGALPCLVF